jgi:thymidylate synthase (FAD)
MWFIDAQNYITEKSIAFYNKALEKGVAKECARFLLPMSTATTLYVTGSIRSWVHYLKLRCDVSTQLEHREIADEIKALLGIELPIIGQILDTK